MVKTFGAEHEARGWQFSFIVYGIAAIIFFLIAFKGTRERVQPPKSQKASIKQDLFELVTTQTMVNSSGNYNHIHSFCCSSRQCNCSKLNF